MKWMRGLLDRRSAAGFSVVELVVSSGILLMVLVSTMSVVTFASTTTSRATQRDRALNIANTAIEQARNMPFDRVGVRYASGGYGEPPGEILTPDAARYPGFTITTSVTWVTSGGRAAYKEMKVSVAWERPTPGEVSLETGIFGATELVNVGDLKVTALDEDTGAPIFRALVHVQPYDATARQMNTGTDGVALFGRVDQGPATVTVSAAGYVFDDALTAAAPVEKDVQCDVVAYGHRASSAAVVVRDAAGPVAGATVSLTDRYGRVLTAVTGADGHAPTFTNLLPGSYTLDVSAEPGRHAEQSSVTIETGGQNVTAEVTIPTALAAGQLRVSTRDATSLRPVSGVALTLFDPRGNQVSGGTVQTVSGQATWASVPPGAYTISASVAGYTAITRRAFTVIAGQQNDVTLDLVPVAVTTGTIRAVVTDKHGRAVSGRVVYIRHPEGNQASASTDGNGIVEWRNLPIGVYTLWLDGRAGATQEATPGNSYTVLTFVDGR